MKLQTILSAILLALVPMTVQGDDYAPDSVYKLDAELQGHNGRSGGIDMNAGNYTIVTMFYGSCPHVCPMLIRTMQMAEEELNEKQRRNLRVLMISLDAERDTPESLAEVAAERDVDDSRWTLASAGANDVRKIAAVLKIRFRKLSDGNFNHTSEMILLDPEGREVMRSDKLGRPAKEFIDQLKAVTS